MERQEHLDWCKQRALEYLDAGDLVNAVASMMSDLSHRPDTDCNNPTLVMFAGMAVTNGDADGVRRFIEGFN